MADIHHIITLGIGTPGDIEHFVLDGLSVSDSPTPTPPQQGEWLVPALMRRTSRFGEGQPVVEPERRPEPADITGSGRLQLELSVGLTAAGHLQARTLGTGAFLLAAETSAALTGAGTVQARTLASGAFEADVEAELSGDGRLWLAMEQAERVEAGQVAVLERLAALVGLRGYDMRTDDGREALRKRVQQVQDEADLAGLI